MTRADRLDGLLHGLMQAMPIGASSALGSALSGVMGQRAHPAADGRARALFARLRPAWGADEAALAAAVRRLWRCVARTHAEFGATRALLTSDRVQTDGAAHLTDALADGRPVISLFLHLGNWEIAAAHTAVLAPDRAMLIYDPPAQAGRRAIAERVRAALHWQPRPLSPQGWRHAVARLSERGGVLVTAADEVAHERVGAPLFWREPFADGNLGKVVRLAMRYHALVVPLWTERVSGVCFRTHVLPAVTFAGDPRDLGAVLDAVCRLDAIVTPPVLMHLDQWYMALEFRAADG